jgi:probable addiction module antidote protein
MKRKLVAAVPHHGRVIEELRADREYAREYLRAAMEEEPAVMLIALRRIAEAYGGLAKIVEKAEIQRESLYRALSPNGNPTLKTFTAVLNAVGMRLSVETTERKRRAA